MDKLSILILEDDERLKNELGEFLESLSFTVYSASKPSEAVIIAGKYKLDIALIDIKLPEYSGIIFLKKIKEWQPEIETIIMSGHGDMDTVIEALRAGAFDYLRKPFSTEELHASLLKTKRYLETQEKTRKLEAICETLKNQQLSHTALIGNSAVMQDLYKSIDQAAKASSTSVLIYGESGTGKELIARKIHEKSPRCDNPFITINCAAIPRDMFESELFGHTKGAFTDAKSSRKGLFRAADQGTLFLDEIGEIPYDLQSKLLRAIETQKIRPVGSDIEVPVSVRIISATNIDLNKAVQEGRFRKDLYYRIAVIIIKAEALRNHPEDIEALAEFYYKIYCEEMGKNWEPLPQSIIKQLRNYDFPGNVRELKNIIERYCILGNLSLSSVFHDHHNYPSNSFIEENLNNKQINATLHMQDCDDLYTESGINLPTLNLEELERTAIQLALKKTNGKHTNAAELLGISRQALERRLSKYK